LCVCVLAFLYVRVFVVCVFTCSCVLRCVYCAKGGGRLWCIRVFKAISPA
jgi:hypothetical protein